MTGEERRDTVGAWKRWNMVLSMEESKGMGIVGGNIKDILLGFESRIRYL